MYWEEFEETTLFGKFNYNYSEYLERSRWFLYSQTIGKYLEFSSFVFIIRNNSGFNEYFHIKVSRSFGLIQEFCFEAWLLTNHILK